jgi:hypothetical protein
MQQWTNKGVKKEKEKLTVILWRVQSFTDLVHILAHQTAVLRCTWQHETPFFFRRRS